MSRDYKVGFGKPPEHTRFQKGRSGNPGGRAKPKPRKPFITAPEEVRQMLIDALEEEISVVENGRKRKMPAIVAIIKQLTVKAVKGDFRTAKFLAETYKKAVNDDEEARIAIMRTLMQREEEREAEYQRNKQFPNQK